MAFSYRPLAGALIFIGAACFLMGIVVAEVLYSGYHATQMISDLGVGAAAPVFNTSIIGFGLLLVASAYLLYKTGTSIWFVILLALTGIGAAGVGIFPETVFIPHAISAITVFVCGSLCALIGVRTFSYPWSWFSPVLGIITLAATFLLCAKVYLGLSAGGMERMIAYPLIIWALGTGSFLMAPEKE